MCRLRIETQFVDKESQKQHEKSFHCIFFFFFFPSLLTIKMRRSKSGHERKSSRRRSWFNGNNLFTMFSSAPPSPDHKITEDPSSLLSIQRSASLTPIERPKYKSAFSTMLSRATKKHHKRTESSNLTQDSQSSIFDYASSMRRCSNKSDATTISDMDYRNNEHSYFQKTQKRQLLKSDEEEADRIQLKNDLVKLAFEG